MLIYATKAELESNCMAACLLCGEISGGYPSDAREEVCEICEHRTVFSLEILLERGQLVVTDAAD